MKMFVFSLVILACYTLSVTCLDPLVLNGRPRGGLIRPPPVLPGLEYPGEQFYEFQYVNHFDGSDFRYWKQRYFVNDTFQTKDGPIFLVLGGEAALNPIWTVQGMWIEYAKQHGAALVLLEHRYYGKSQPVKDLTADNLQYLSSRQALADAAQFIPAYKEHTQAQNSKVVVFGASYSGSLAVWFRSKYPTLVLGAVASSPHLLASMDFIEYYVAVTRILDQTYPKCSTEIRQATDLMYRWWYQQDKLPLMDQMFRLCDRLDPSFPLDLSVLFYNLAEQFANIVQYNGDNIAAMGDLDANITINTLCDIMTDVSRGDAIQRYADVSNRLLDANKETCLNIRHSKLIESLNYTKIDNDTFVKGGRQWLYQQCSELGWIHTTSSPKQPFGQYWYFPFNFTSDQCVDLFRSDVYKGSFYRNEIIENTEETNMYYGGRDVPISNAILVNHEMDPFWNATGPQNLPYSRNTQILVVKGTAHIADIYPPSDRDPPQLTQARETISQTIGKWLADYRSYHK